jgi:Flp pilus assembly protein TadG
MKRFKGPKSRRGVVAVEAALTLPLLLVFMLGLWEVGRMIQVNQTLVNAAREGARLAAGGYVNTTPVTSAMVKQAVRDYMTSAGLPAAAVSGATISLVCQATPSWTDPANALPLDRFQVNLVIPQGAAFNSLRWNLLNRLTSIQQFSVTVNWMSLNSSQIVVPTQLPF